MANKRAENQEFIGIWLSNSLVVKIDSSRGILARSQWIRTVIADALVKAGYEVTFEERTPTDRIKGKTGYPLSRHEKPSSKKASGAEELLDEVEGAAASQPPKSRRKQ